MSLINEALRKARQEAAEQEAEERAAGGTKGKAVYREPRAHLPTRSKMGIGLVVGVLLGVIVAGIGGFGVWWLTARDRPAESLPSEAAQLAGEASSTHTSSPTSQEVDPESSARADDPAPEASRAPRAANQQQETSAPVPLETSELTKAEARTVSEPAPTVDATPPDTRSGEAPELTRVSNQAERAPGSRPVADPARPEAEVVSTMASSAPVAADPESTPSPDEEGLPKLIEPPEAIGQVGDTNVFVLEADLGDDKVILDFIVWNPSSPFAQINGKQVEVGQLVAGLLVEKIERDQVTLKATDGRIVLRVR